MERSFTLDDFKFPGVALNHDNTYFGFGSKKAAETPLNFDEMADATAFPFAKQKAEDVTENIEISKIDYDLKLKVSAGVTITLPTANVRDGIYVTFFPNFTSNEKATITDSTNTWTLESTTNLTLTFDGTKWKRNNYSLNDKINIMLNSCYTDRDLRKVLFDLGDIEADDWTEITCLQVMEALHNRCQNDDFSGLGLGDFIEHDTIVVPSCSVTDLNGSTYTWGLVDGKVQKGGGELTITKNTVYHPTKIRIANFGNIHGGSGKILFEYNQIPFNGKISVQGSGFTFNKSSVYQWLNTSYYPVLNSALGGYIQKTSRYFFQYNSTGEHVSDGCYLFFPDSSEVAGYPVIGNNDYAIYQYSRWGIYANKPSLVKKRNKTVPYNWWLSSGCSGGYGNNFAYVDIDGNFSYSAANNDYGCSPAFYIG